MSYVVFSLLANGIVTQLYSRPLSILKMFKEKKEERRWIQM